MATLLSYAEQQALKAISANNQSKYTQIATEVENNELRQLIGAAFLNDLQINYATLWNGKLLNGDSYNDCAGNAVKHRGLKFVLSYLNYVKYLNVSDVADTFTGFVAKTHENAQPLAEGRIIRLQNDAKNIALSEFEMIKQYLDLNAVNFPYWYYSTPNKKIYTPVFTGIRKTGRQKQNNIEIANHSICNK